MTFDPSFVPVLRSDLLRRDLGHESLIWSPIRAKPTSLDPVASVMLQVVDGAATVADLASDVEDVVGIDASLAEARVQGHHPLRRGKGPRDLTACRAHGTSTRAVCEPPEHLSGEEGSSREDDIGQPQDRGDSGSHRVRPTPGPPSPQDVRRTSRRRRGTACFVVSPLGTASEVRAARSMRLQSRLHHRQRAHRGDARRSPHGLGAGRRITCAVPSASGDVGHGFSLRFFPLLFVPPSAVDQLRADGFSVIDRLAVDLESRSGAMVQFRDDRTVAAPWRPPGPVRGRSSSRSPASSSRRRANCSSHRAQRPQPVCVPKGSQEHGNRRLTLRLPSRPPHRSRR